MEVEAAVRKHLLADSTVTGYVVDKVYKFRLGDPLPSGRAITVRRYGGWASPDVVKTSEYPAVEVRCYATDSITDGDTVVGDAEENAWAVYRAVDPLLHARRDEWWGAGPSNTGLWVITSHRNAEPVVFEATTTEPLYVSARYGLQVVHGVAA